MDTTNQAPRVHLKLADFLPYRLAVLSNTISSQLARIYEGEFGLTVRQWQVMAIIAENDGFSAKEIVTKTALDKVAVSRSVSALIELGYCRRKAAKDDARLSALHLTKNGKSVYFEIAPLVQARERELVKGLSPNEHDALLKAIQALADAASPDKPLW